MLALCSSAEAATFIVPNDRALIHEATAIVIASPLGSHAEELDDGFIRTVTTMSVQSVLKGVVLQQTIDLYEPGGTIGDRATMIPGVPRFNPGENYVLFLMSGNPHWHVLNLVLGKFTYSTSANGAGLLVRDYKEINGWDPDGTPHIERSRNRALFLQFIRDVVAGRTGDDDYFDGDPVPPRRTPRTNSTSASAPVSAQASLLPIPAAAPYSAASYTFTVSGALGARWNVFPAPVSWFSVGTEPGAPGGGVNAITAAFAAWNNDPSSNVNYVYAGADATGTHLKGLSGSDNANTIMFERDLSAYGIPAFQCSGNSYGGTLGLGGVTKAGVAHAGPNNESFLTTLEGDVEMNQGVANCTLLFNNGDFNSAVAHEVGHTLGFRHSDQTRADDPSIPCATDTSLECSDTAIMKSFVPTGLNAALQAWDQHAVAAVYPPVASTSPSPVTNVTATAQTTTRVVVTWSAAPAATSYEVYRRGPSGATFTLIGSSTTTSYTDNSVSANSAYLYRVRLVTATGTSADSNADLATTVIFTDNPLVPRVTVVKAIHLAELRTAVNAVRVLAGLPAISFTDPASRGVIIRAYHITDLRTALDAAMSALSLRTGGYTDSSLLRTVIKAIHFQELRDRVR